MVKKIVFLFVYNIVAMILNTINNNDYTCVGSQCNGKLTTSVINPMIDYRNTINYLISPYCSACGGTGRCGNC